MEKAMTKAANKLPEEFEQYLDYYKAQSSKGMIYRAKRILSGFDNL